MRNIFYSFLIISTIVTALSCASKNNLPDPLAAGWKGSPVCELLYENSDIRVLKCTFKPGIGHEKHYHDPHFGYTLSGSTFQMIDDKGKRVVEVPTGSHFYSKGTEGHEVLNVGDSTGIFLIFEHK